MKKSTNDKNGKKLAIQTGAGFKNGLHALRVHFADVKPVHLTVIAMPFLIALTFLFLPKSLDIQHDNSATFTEVVADHSRPTVGHAYSHSGKTEFFAISKGLTEKMHWFCYANHERGKAERFARKFGSYFLGCDFDHDMDGAFVISDSNYEFGDVLKDGRYVYLGKIKSKLWLLKEFCWEYPVYMDARLTYFEKKRLLANFKKDMIKSLQQDDTGKKVAVTENGAVFDGGFLSPDCSVEVL